VISSCGGYFTNQHHLIPADADWVLEVIDVPELKDGHVHTYMGGV